MSLWPSHSLLTTLSTSAISNFDGGIVVNGDFSRGNFGWTLDLGFTIADGKLCMDNDGSFAQAVNAGQVVAGRTYRLQFDISDYVSGTVRIIGGGVDFATGFSGNGSVNELWRPTVSGNFGFVRGTVGMPNEMCIDNVRVIEEDVIIGLDFSLRFNAINYQLFL